jgi:uncharacterized phage protein gp47/JayE
MAYFAPYISEDGLHIPTYVDIRDDLVAQFKQIYGDDLYLADDSQDYQLLSAFALKTYDTMQLLQIVWNNHSPKTAVGSALSSLVKLNGIARKAASYSTCVLTITGTTGTVIATGSVKDDSGNIWDLPANTTLTGTTTEVTAICETLGAVEAAVGTITTINTPQAGWTAVTNAVPAVVGQPIETDAELRARQTVEVAIPSQNMVDSTIAGIAAITGVTRYKVYDNDTNVTDENGIPGHSMASVVEGGLDADVAEQIYLRKGPGSGTYGSSSATYTNSSGIDTIIHFSRPTYTGIDVNVEVTPGFGYSSEILATIQANIEAYIKGLDIGVDVSATGILTAITAAIENPARPSFSLGSITLGEEGQTPGIIDVPIAWNAAASVGTVTVTEVT